MTEPAPEAVLEDAIAIVVELCKRFEGFSAHPYICPGGKPTIGYGATYYLDGRKVKMTDAPISRETAERLLINMVKREYMPGVLLLCPGLRDERAGRAGAIGDFAYNLGIGNLKISTLRKRINEGDWEAAKVELLRWNKAGGRVLRGLVLRREREAQYI